ncbi:hypothetical protein DFH01_16225 [Falsiroseomonas bella]|uniref:Glycosyltransferase RgtA/B/C/D-like domain-containing protein n=1 Tax=Falsiroseomonas bella TaxID=2184016 RepID=A0A317FFG4_9PROT|nr:hypothetical protein [Falsiroseomonas bella]PWS36679.1 hypothetical protein DFH01_16225 [Falsiroseomonas bella]
MRRSGGRLLPTALLLTAAALLGLAAAANPDRFNPDAVAYLTLARHWREGAWDLATSGYWGPLLPWMVAALLPLTGDLLAAARLAMAASALVFLGGGLALLRATGLPAAAQAVGGLCLMGFALAWSIQIITPDLLVSGLLLAGLAAALRPGWPRRLAGQALAGLLLGLAYYAKAVALPLGLGLLVLCGLWHMVAWRAGWRGAWAALRSGVVMLLVAAPWIGLLSAQYSKPSFGTSGALNLAIAGPSYVAAAGDRFDPHHPAFTSFHAPRGGRVTAWEEPTEMAYVSWTPWADAASLRHFGRLIRYNAELSLRTLRGFDAFGLGLAALLLAPLAAVAGAQPWRMAVLPAAMVAAIYLPVLSNGEPRYLMLAYPLMFAAAAGIAFTLAGEGAWQGLRRALAALLLLVAFLLPLRHDVAVALLGRPNPALLAAREVAAAMQAQDVPGGVASVGELGFAAIFTAFLAERPFLGTEAALPPRERLAALQAGVLLVAPGGAADRALQAEPGAARLLPPGPTVAAWRLR